MLDTYKHITHIQKEENHKFMDRFIIRYLNS